MKCIIGLCLLIAPTRLIAQTAESRNAGLVSYQALAASIERSGASHPRDSASVAAGTERRCVDVAKGPAISGEFSVRGFERYASNWSRGGGGKLTWWPVRPRVGDSLMVRTIRATAPNDTTTFRFGGPVRTGMTQSPVMYPSGVSLSDPGDWFMVATAGPAWGCFFYHLPAR